MKRLARVQRELKAPKDQKGYGYTYRKASDVLEALKPLLEKDNLSVLLCDEIKEVGGKFFLVASAALYGDDGNEIAKTSAFAEMDTHKGMSAEQNTGSASSYARKYALCGLFAIDDSANDPDGMDNSKPEDQERVTKQPASKTSEKPQVDKKQVAAAIERINAQTEKDSLINLMNGELADIKLKDATVMEAAKKKLQYFSRQENEKKEVSDGAA